MSPRDRRAIRLGVALTIVAIAIVRNTAVAAHWFGTARDEVAAAREVLVRQDAQMRLLPELEARGDSLRRAVTRLAGRLLAGGTEAEAQAELLASVESASSRSGNRLDQLEPLADSVGFGRLRRVLARATVSSDFPGILGLIDRLESGSQIGLVRSLRIERAGQAPAPEQDVLRAELVVEGWFMRREGVATND